MRWLFAVFFLFIAAHCAAAMFTAKAHQEIDSVEEKIKRLEQEVGIKPEVYRTTFNFFGDFLYWKASLDGVAYATTAVSVVNPDGTAGFNRFKTKTAHFDYDPGFIIGAGIGLPYDNWDIGTQWLRFHTEGNDHARGSRSEAPGHPVILDTIGMIEPLPSPPSRARADCSIHLDVLDFVLGRSFLWSKYFNFRPFAGLRAAWVDIDWDIAFTRAIDAAAYLDVDNDFDAIGFIGGFESEWTLYKGFGLFSYSSASLIYGKSSERTQEKFFLKGAKQPLTAHNSAHTVKAVFDLVLGLKWVIRFKDHYAFHLRAGYDFFYWPSVTQKTVIQNSRIRDRADLSFEGLILGAKFEF